MTSLSATLAQAMLQAIPAPVTDDPHGLVPCPFCRSAAEFYPDGDMEGHSVMCSGKGALFGGDRRDCPLRTFGYASMEEARLAWNARALMTAQIVERVSALAGEWERLALAQDPRLEGATGVQACAQSLRDLLAQTIVDQMRAEVTT